VSFTSCQQKKKTKNELSDKVNIEFTSEDVKITHNKFEVTCDFTTVNVTHTFVNGLLNITQKGSPNQADCVCHTDVSYTIKGILQNEVNVIFLNGVQVYCHNDNGKSTVILLEKYCHFRHHNNSTSHVYEYDAQYRISKRLNYSYSGTLFSTETLTYNANRDLVEVSDEKYWNTITFTKNGNKISDNIGGSTFIEIEMNYQGLPVKLSYLSGNRVSETHTYTWENGNVTQEDWEYYGGEYFDSSSGTYTYIYDDKKSPFYYCTTPKWFLLYWHGIDYCCDNNLETVEFSWHPDIFTCKNSYNDNGFIATRTAPSTVLSERYDYMKR
jgi:hypothetical protein